ncbi:MULTISPECIES: secondary thiamine-phosphate synthase enzyme YjbQ [unclassified Fusibacter]|uniref:secondary thiamine-phosphate synthase enzyme YjbQ n=1 Tax=unclassified Fusibacter TaxID=2624464 RepID=UPI00101176D2|nr:MULTISPECIES: secondary thiamine-phosphate synthase enzyme YjbQ [unclassified Fusibacter]MCK8060158.1 secondary thiamine-phosphate synthase enzyme YjbQ [Fusibacter sp. A2]NPE22298.1 YjbQ family protein [Fusibacter sp. A1]RXV61071.1 YjbQ family protein [Fusibacter sp. A1]
MRQVKTVIQVRSKGHQTMIDVTREVGVALQESGIRNGMLVLFVPHTTAAVTINENADPHVVRDMLAGLEKVFPEKGDYRHYEGNSHAHLKSSCIGVDQTVLVENGLMLLGTWQGIYFCEFDGPRTRELVIKVMGD